jgi:hypothetical protein
MDLSFSRCRSDGQPPPGRGIAQANLPAGFERPALQLSRPHNHGGLATVVEEVEAGTLCRQLTVQLYHDPWVNPVAVVRQSELYSP